MHPMFIKSAEDITYGWIIVKDKIDNGSEVGTMGPNGCPFTAEEIKSKGEKFRMSDDDDEIYYYGFLYNPDGEEEGEFAPLDDFGAPNAGCVNLEYKNKDGKYQAI